MKTFSFGFNKAEADVTILDIMAIPFVAITFSNISIQTHLIGLYNANNINAAITIGKYFNIPENDIKSAIENYIPENNRSQLIYKNTNEIILDAYNANPSSMAVEISNFIQLERENKIVILGDMFELGTESSLEHKAVVNSLLNEIQIACYFMGKDFYFLKI
ncbi:glutamate ligase domain-containing protein [Flavobacterium myungsuense]